MPCIKNGAVIVHFSPAHSEKSAQYALVWLGGRVVKMLNL